MEDFRMTQGELEKVILEYLQSNCPECCMAKENLAEELAQKIHGLLSDRCPEGGCYADI